MAAREERVVLQATAEGEVRAPRGRRRSAHLVLAVGQDLDMAGAGLRRARAAG